jgi:hypothetical protein
MRTSTLATFHCSTPATRLKNWLARAGVPGAVRHPERRHWLPWKKSLPAFQLDVPHDHVQHARALLSEWEHSSDALHDAVRCPQCKTLRVRYPHVPARYFSAPVARLLWVVGFLPSRFSCKECGHTWRVPQSTDLLPASDVNSAAGTI